MKLELHDTENPISNAERLKINENWQRIISGFSYLQRQIKVLAGGADVDELLQRLNDAVENANKAVQQAINANKKVTQEAVEANNAALQKALNTVSQTLEGVKKTIADAKTATTEANAAKQGALDATAQTQTALSSMQTLLTNMSPRGIWNETTQYYKNNMALFKGSTFIALQDNLGQAPPTLPTQSNAYWSLFAEKGAKGDKGEKGDKGADGKDGTGITIISSLTSEKELPSTGSPGDAYMINGDLYVWQVNTKIWRNVGPIQGPHGKSAYDLAVENGFNGTMKEWIDSLKGIQGPQGPVGPPGPPGETPDISNFNQQMNTLQTNVNEHIENSVLHAHFVRAKQDDNSTYNLTIPGISAYVPGIRILLEPTETNKDGKVTFNINGLGPKAVSFQNRYDEGQDPVIYIQNAETLQSYKVYEFVYNGRDFNVIGIPFITDNPEFALFDKMPVSARAVRGLNELKANKKLPNSIQCTLEAGWSHQGNAPLTYFKDDFGIVHVQGQILKTGSPTHNVCTVLPVGFRPRSDVDRPQQVVAVGYKHNHRAVTVPPIVTTITIERSGFIYCDSQLDKIVMAFSFRTD
ncbi:hypothetical protein ACIQ1H_05295 [Lysinibacillus sp. NPDC097279]|uniref:hypothetical protein n=1 Tax=Lysinibacillus sp. NPDC097279 TaxID=3364143 RepID=UPI003800C9EF